MSHPGEMGGDFVPPMKTAPGDQIVPVVRFSRAEVWHYRDGVLVERYARGADLVYRPVDEPTDDARGAAS